MSPNHLHELLFAREVLGNSPAHWGAALLVFLASLILLLTVKRVLRRRVASWMKRSSSEAVALVSAVIAVTRGPLLTVVALYLGVQVLYLPDEVRGGAHVVATLAVLLQGGFWANALLTHMINARTRRGLEGDAASATTLSVLGFLCQWVLWTILALLALENLGVNVTTLVAGLGVGGVAVALAAQTVLRDPLASLSIILDKPFVLGDNIAVGDLTGTVEYIGLRTTKVRSVSGEQLIFPNSDLLQSRIRNYKRMQERRAAFTLAVAYETPLDKLRQIPNWIQRIVEQKPQVRFDRSHFKEYGTIALNFETVYFMLTTDYKQFMDTQQQINLEILERFAQEGIKFVHAPPA
ncbi:MAG: mechanosensitive ion channel family protein [Planctomycetes bacterium]|nr:mechanosensitive ion channel family protein [Planctomycetota bacterium]